LRDTAIETASVLPFRKYASEAAPIAWPPGKAETVWRTAYCTCTDDWQQPHAQAIGDPESKAARDHDRNAICTITITKFSTQNPNHIGARQWNLRCLLVAANHKKVFLEMRCTRSRKEQRK
jgi:hypothetical protein